ncbi:MAG: hypothetical protein CMJ81_24430 [Planctomycetaceae bacterium]|nr:hypothetical protein [Planctomycetaceae bacterium]MBP60703.1 hypothetical protein [Planctomycetaceae bacterium]
MTRYGNHLLVLGRPTSLVFAVVLLWFSCSLCLLAAPGDHTWIGPTSGAADWDNPANWSNPEGGGNGNGIPDYGNEKAILNSTLSGDRDIRWKGFDPLDGPLIFAWTANGNFVDKLTLDENMHLLDAGEPPIRFSNTSGNSDQMVFDLNGFTTTRLPAAFIVPGMTFTDSSAGQTGVLDFTQGFRMHGGDGTFSAEGAHPMDIVFDPSISAIRSGPGRMDLVGHSLANLTLYNSRDANPLNPENYYHVAFAPGGTINDFTIEDAGYFSVNGTTIQINGDLTVPLDPDGFTGLLGGAIQTWVKVTGNVTDPNTTFTSLGGGDLTSYDEGHLVFNGGGNIQTVDIAQTDLGFRLQVADNSHLQLLSDYHQTNPVGEHVGFWSKLGADATLDVGSHTLSVPNLAGPGHSEGGPVVNLIYGEGGAINVESNLISFVNLSIEITNLDSHTPGDDFTLITYGDSSNPGVGTNLLSPNLVHAVLPPGWSHDGLEWDGITGGTIRLMNVNDDTPPPPPVLCDFDGDFFCNASDLNLMYSENFHDLVNGVATTEATEKFDLVDDDVVDNLDIDQWLAQAATENGYDSPYQRGDTDDLGNQESRDIDLTDYNTLAVNFSPIGTGLNWDQGNFDGDNDIDLRDYNVLAAHFHPGGYGMVTAPVPEPSSVILCIFGLMLVPRRLGQRQCH